MIKQDVENKIKEYTDEIEKLVDCIIDYEKKKKVIMDEKAKLTKELNRITRQINFNETHIDASKYKETNLLVEQTKELTGRINDLYLQKVDIQEKKKDFVKSFEKCKRELNFLTSHANDDTVLTRLSGRHAMTKQDKLERYYTYPSVIKRLEDRKAKKE